MTSISEKLWMVCTVSTRFMEIKDLSVQDNTSLKKSYRGRRGQVYKTALRLLQAQDECTKQKLCEVEKV